jgi:hypothetical protein
MHLLEVRQDVIPAPSSAADLGPLIIVRLGAAYDEGPIQGAVRVMCVSSSISRRRGEGSECACILPAIWHEGQRSRGCWRVVVAGRKGWYVRPSFQQTETRTYNGIVAPVVHLGYASACIQSSTENETCRSLKCFVALLEGVNAARTVQGDPAHHGHA